MSGYHEERVPTADGRAYALLGFLFLGVSILLIRLWYIQVVRSPELKEKAETLGRISVAKPPPRGLIVDRNGTLLAGVKSQLVVTAQPRIALGNAAVIQRVAKMVGVDAGDLREDIEREKWRGYLPFPVVTNIPIDVATKIAELERDLPGFSVSSQPVRVYYHPKAYSHLIGYVRPPSEKDVERLKDLGVEEAGVFVGKSGVEYAHELELMGVPGRQELERDPRLRRDTQVTTTSEPTPGNKLILGLDAQLQQHALEALAGRKGAVVAIDPRNGDILCMVSQPSYDNSWFVRGLSHQEADYLYKNEDRPTYNRATQATYQPGSTFKIVTAVAAQLAGKFHLDAPAYCGGAYVMGKGKPIKCLGHHGSITFKRAFQKSCNTYFCDLAVKAGTENMRKACELLGLGPLLDVDLREESRSIIPTAAWVEKNRDGAWYKGNLAQFGIGQDAVTMTPLQMANLMATVANGGTVYRPRAVRAVQPFSKDKPEEIPPQVIRKITEVPESFWHVLQEACVGVVEGGTARAGHIPGIMFGGKTGRAEDGRKGLTHSWFVCFAPAENPRIAMAVMAENAGHGGEIAVPIASKLLKAYLEPKPTPQAQKLASNSVRTGANSSTRSGLPTAR